MDNKEYRRLYAGPLDKRGDRNSVVAEVPQTIRETILTRFVPRQKFIYAMYVTLAYRVPVNFRYNRMPHRFTVIALHRDEESDLLLLSAQQEGARRPTPFESRLNEAIPLHLTLSVGEIPPFKAVERIRDENIQEIPNGLSWVSAPIIIGTKVTTPFLHANN